MRFPDFKNELKYLKKGFDLVAGCDEVGMGPLAGPVVAAACILDPKSIGKYRTRNKWYHRVRDSKTINEGEREVLQKEILKNCLAYGVGEVWQEEIDQLNIHHASLLAMRRAVEGLLEKIKGEKVFLLVDGRFKIPEILVEQKAVIDGDALILSISAASIIAKVHRDKIMHLLHQKFPQYGFKNHKGYSTREHKVALKKWGISQVHRKSFVK
jgi:ribonuclease HII